MKANINININLEIGDFRMETSLGPTLAEFMYGPESVHIFKIYARILGPYINYMRELDPAFLSRRPKSRGALFAVSALTRTGVVK